MVDAVDINSLAGLPTIVAVSVCTHHRLVRRSPTPPRSSEAKSPHPGWLNVADRSKGDDLLAANGDYWSSILSFPLVEVGENEHLRRTPNREADSSLSFSSHCGGSLSLEMDSSPSLCTLDSEMEKGSQATISIRPPVHSLLHVNWLK